MAMRITGMSKFVRDCSEKNRTGICTGVGPSAGQWAEGALLLFLFSMGHSLEHYAMGRARRDIEELAELAPERATVRRNGGTTE
jgi:cation transport ATPase